MANGNRFLCQLRAVVSTGLTLNSRFVQHESLCYTSSVMPMTPAAYASRYLPVVIPDGQQTVSVQIDRYPAHLGAAGPAQQTLWSALGDHFVQQQRRDRSYRLPLTVNRIPVMVGGREEIRMPAVRPFWGKGSPEDCQVVLQLALLLNLTTSRELQTWANTNLGLDCNGFVGNYLFHAWMGSPWSSVDGKDDPGPSQTIDKLFHWAAGKDEHGALTDLDELDADATYLVVRTDQDGRIIPGPHPVGHCAVTEPGTLNPSYSSMDLTRAKDQMIGNPALRSFESAGPVKGLGRNWMIFVRPLKPKNVFEIQRDHIRKADPVKLVRLTK
jgi:hypothetical protein